MGRLLRFVLRGQNSLMHKLCDALDLKNMTLKKFGQCLLNKAGTFSRLTFTRFQYNILLTGYENRRACQLEHVIIIQNQVLLSYFQGNVRHSKGRITSWILGLNKRVKKNSSVTSLSQLSSKFLHVPSISTFSALTFRWIFAFYVAICSSVCVLIVFSF